MRRSIFDRGRPAVALLVVFAAALVAGCATPPPTATRIDTVLGFDEAAASAADGLAGQTQKLPGFLARVESKLNKRLVVLDPMLESTTGQQTATTQRLERQVSDRLGNRADPFEILPFQTDNLGRAQYLLTGTTTRVEGAATPRQSTLQIHLALTDLKSGLVVAQASALARDQGLDHTPLAYYRDSPILVKDAVIDGYNRTSATPPGQRAEPYYFERISAAALIGEATDLYNQERYAEALARYRSALALPHGDQLRVLNGIYLANVRLGRSADAEQAFGRVVALGIATNQLGVKLLFNPGGLEFWADPRVSGVYPMWMRQIARESLAAKACLNIVGHTSRTGTDQVNETLSLQRANIVRQRLVAEAPSLAARSKTEGRGFRENIVGSASDNAVDALDRRVEFRIVPCG